MQSICYFSLLLTVSYICDMDCIYIFIFYIKLTGEKSSDI